MELKTINYFSQSMKPIISEISEVLDNPNHPEYNNLLNDIQSIDLDELNKFINEKDIDFYIRNVKNIDLERKAFFLSDCLYNDIACRRIETLVSNKERPMPYDSVNLKNILINNEKLVDISCFEYNNGLIFNNFSYRLCPSIDQDNSSYWLFQEIIKLIFTQQKKFYIRLDPFFEKPINEYRPMLYKMTVYGKPLNWERLKNMQKDDFGQFINEKEYDKYSKTDYIWHVEKNEIHFTCEELPTIESYKIRGSRYFHAIFDKLTGNIIHCDGAIRIYNKAELDNRMRIHVKSVDARKVGKRVKIFKTNDILNNQDFSKLVVSFFIWNDDLLSYFSKNI
ncbi:hypothetical protein [uncultured Bacteroides sp.]|uniref:hypothetical protein n=1 Tax=uncultured Bacteroides sp. TaxID=162156 RepID=UPI0037482FD5